MPRAGSPEAQAHPAGLHLEVSPDPVLECRELVDIRDGRRGGYHSACDPRLNPVQARWVVECFADLVRG